MEKYLILALCGFAWTGGPPGACDPASTTGALSPGPILREPSSPYPLSYTDEVARRLGITHGHMDIFSVTPDRTDGLVPSLKGAVDRDGAGFKLQWQIGK